jgi:hypothetical protein
MAEDDNLEEEAAQADDEDGGADPGDDVEAHVWRAQT